MKANGQHQFINPLFYLRRRQSSQQQATQPPARRPDPARRKSLFVSALALALLLGSTVASATAALPATVRSALGQANIDPAAVSIWVQALDAEQPSLQFNASNALNPASLMKLVTAFVSFEHFGPAYSWQTRLSSAQAINANGELDGNLYLIGSGDPMLDHARLNNLLRRLRALGLQRIKGDIVLDATVLQLPAHDPAAFDGRGLRPYNSGPHGLLLNYNSLLVALFPQRPRQAVQAVIEPALDGLQVSNRIAASDGPCQVWHRDLEANLDPTNGQLILSGTLPSSCGPRTWSAAPLPPPAYAEALVRALWRDNGGLLDGQVRHGMAPAQAQTLLTHDSPTLAEIIREMNKWSSNLIARQLIANLAIGSSAPASANMVSAGIELAHYLLTRADIDTRGLLIENGSGLSRIARIRADSLGQLLVRAWQRPWMPEFIAALPIAGVDGTARRHLGRSPARGQAHIKTGTINEVRAIAGYVLDRQGRRHAVVMMINHSQAHASAAALDALLEWVWSGAS